MTQQAQRRTPNSKWSVVGIYRNYTAYRRNDFYGLSSLVNISDEHFPAHEEWLVSFSKANRARLSNKEIKVCLKDWCLEGFLEDNHEPGLARKFWMAVEEKYRLPCACQDETVIVEGDYRYSVKKQVML